MDTLPDIDSLIRQGPGSEAQVIDAMVATYRAGLGRLAAAYLGDADEAEDAVQQVFIAAAGKLASYQPGTNFKAWLYTIAANTCRGMLRKRQRRRALLNLLRWLGPEIDAGPEEAAQERDSRRWLWSAVGRLDEKHRMAVILRYQQGLSIQEMAQALGVPEKTAYNRLYDAFQKLRRLLADEQGEPLHMLQEDRTP